MVRRGCTPRWIYLVNSYEIVRTLDVIEIIDAIIPAGAQARWDHA